MEPRQCLSDPSERAVPRPHYEPCPAQTQSVRPGICLAAYLPAVEIDWLSLMEPVARRLLGEPTSIGNGEKTWRYGRKGSLAVHVGGSGGLVGTWTDFESGDRGNVLALIRKGTQLRQRRGYGLAAPPRVNPLRGPARSDRDASILPPHPGFPDCPSTPDPRGPPRLLPAQKETARRQSTPASCGLRGVPADDTPGRTYLTERWVWPGLHVPGAPNLPVEVVRWVSRRIAAKTVDPRTGQRLWLPKGAAGALMFAFTEAAGNVVGVQLEGLTADGERTPCTIRCQELNRFRQFRGRVAGAYMLLRRTESKSLLILVEGPADALAAWWLWPNASAVWSCAGTSGLAKVQPDHVTSFDTVALAADGDRAGQQAAWRTAVRLVEAGISVKRWPSSCGADPADCLAERLQERTAIFEFDGGLPPLEAEAMAWTPYL